ncbi:ECF transporter, substrate-specific component [Candidatus Nanopelagicaceae bacterium]
MRTQSATRTTSRVFTFSSLSLYALIATSFVGLLGFTWPFYGPSESSTTQWIFLAAVPLALFLLFISVSNENLDTKSIALLAVLSALIAALRPLGTGAVGIEPMWFILILASRVFGASFGFLLGAISMLLSALITGGVGPWLAYQCFAAGWIGMGAGLLPKKVGSRLEIAMLILYGIFAAEFFGIAMDLQFWPWTLGSDTQLSYIPGGAISENLDRFFSYHFLSALAWDIPRAITTSILIAIAGVPVLRALRRAYSKAAFLTPVEFIEREKAKEAEQR